MPATLGAHLGYVDEPFGDADVALVVLSDFGHDETRLVAADVAAAAACQPDRGSSHLTGIGPAPHPSHQITLTATARSAPILCLSGFLCPAPRIDSIAIKGHPSPTESPDVQAS